MNTYYNHPSALDIFRRVINNAEFGSIITRTEILNVSKETGAFLAHSYIDNTRRQLTVCGFLEYTGIPGKYIVRAHVPESWTIHTLKIETEKQYDTHVDTYINNSKKQTEEYMKIVAEREARGEK